MLSFLSFFEWESLELTGNLDTLFDRLKRIGRLDVTVALKPSFFLVHYVRAAWAWYVKGSVPGRVVYQRTPSILVRANALLVGDPRINESVSRVCRLVPAISWMISDSDFLLTQVYRIPLPINHKFAT